MFFAKPLHFQGSSFMLLYSLYSWPNVFLCFIGGYLIDRVFGIRYVLYLFQLFYTNGNLPKKEFSSLNSSMILYRRRLITYQLISFNSWSSN